MSSLNTIRSSFLNFFEASDHRVTPSAPLVPKSDPTLLFTNAGMVPFKNVFTGVETPPSPRAVSSQKCLRAGGKHNDLDNVGYTARHHTFFEMLGNFSFGDYFKEEAIAFAWDLVTKEFALPVQRLLATVYVDDDEAFDLWRKIAGLPEDKILRIAGSDNFWSMGDTGPCGPCSEIFYDHGPEIPGGPPGSPDEDGDRFIEIWNLVFMQFDRSADGAQNPLPKPSIDTGMGLERIGAVLQGVHSNYETDLFRKLLDASAEACGNDDPDGDASRRVIADHVRAGAFLIADGVTPSNDGRGYVLRRILRRAMRHAHLLGAADPVMHRVAPVLIAEMGGHFTELKRAEALIVDSLKGEEERFRAMLDRGLSLLDGETATMAEGDALPGAVAFKLYDTFGFPLDLTQDALRARGLTVDAEGFDAAMAEQKARARRAWAGSGEAADEGVWFTVRDEHGPTEFTGYGATEGAGRIVALVGADGAAVEAAREGDEIRIAFNQTPFYAESGGQVGDHGAGKGAGFTLEIGNVTKAAGGVFVHHARVVEGVVRQGDEAALSVDAARRAPIRSNHSATHLLHQALRDRLGDHVAQKGSLVAPDRLRFDISHNAPVTLEERTAVEADVNRLVRQNAPVETRVMAYDDAVAAGAMALFGEKYGDEVRVVSMGARPDDAARTYSMELCGGTHVARTGDIGAFVLVGEAGVASGVRRVEALTGEAAIDWLKARAAMGEAAADALKIPLDDLEARVKTLFEDKRKLERELAEAKKALALGGGGGPSEASAAVRDVKGVKVHAQAVSGVGGKDLRSLVDEAKSALGSGVAAFVSDHDGKAALAVGVSADLTDRLDAVALVRAGAGAVGGKGGGGRADFAQAGGPNGGAAGAAVEAILQSVEAMLT